MLIGLTPHASMASMFLMVHAVSFNNGRTWHEVVAERSINCVSTKCRPARWVTDWAMWHVRDIATLSDAGRCCVRCAR